MVLENIIQSTCVYGSEVWGGAKKESSKVQTVLNQGLRYIVQGKSRNATSVSVMQLELDMTPVYPILAGKRLRVGRKGLKLSRTLKQLMESRHKWASNLSSYLKKSERLCREIFKEIAEEVVCDMEVKCGKWISGHNMLTNAKVLTDHLWNGRDLGPRLRMDDILKEVIPRLWLKQVKEDSSRTLEEYMKQGRAMSRRYLDVWLRQPEWARGCQVMLQMRCGCWYGGDRICPYGDVDVMEECPCCGMKGKETLEHYLFTCERFKKEREEMAKGIRSRLGLCEECDMKAMIEVVVGLRCITMLDEKGEECVCVCECDPTLENRSDAVKCGKDIPMKGRGNLDSEMDLGIGMEWKPVEEVVVGVKEEGLKDDKLVLCEYKGNKERKVKGKIDGYFRVVRKKETAVRSEKKWMRLGRRKRNRGLVGQLKLEEVVERRTQGKSTNGEEAAILRTSGGDILRTRENDTREPTVRVKPTKARKDLGISDSTSLEELHKADKISSKKKEREWYSRLKPILVCDGKVNLKGFRGEFVDCSIIKRRRNGRRLLSRLVCRNWNDMVKSVSFDKVDIVCEEVAKYLTNTYFARRECVRKWMIKIEYLKDAPNKLKAGKYERGGNGSDFPKARSPAG